MELFMYLIRKSKKGVGLSNLQHKNQWAGKNPVGETDNPYKQRGLLGSTYLRLGLYNRLSISRKSQEKSRRQTSL